VLANRAVYSALKRVPALCDKEERLRRDPRLAKGDQAASATHKRSARRKLRDASAAPGLQVDATLRPLLHHLDKTALSSVIHNQNLNSMASP
jgi:hypothetical protein